jgi:predicted RNA-binding protein (virulence factor B family)
MPNIGDFILARVVSVVEVGAFLDWGQEKDLFLPYSEQTHNLKSGEDVLVKVYIDNTERTASSMRLERFLNKEFPTFKPEDKVDLIIFSETELGYKAVINQTHSGIIYKNEVFQPIRYGDELTGYIKKIREDGKIDLILQPFGNKGAGDLGQKILDLLAANAGFMAITDKTTPEKIYELFGVSKKKYKIALGHIYKKKLIVVTEEGIKLVV